MTLRKLLPWAFTFALAGCAANGPPVSDPAEAALHPKLVTDLSSSATSGPTQSKSDLYAATRALSASNPNADPTNAPRVFMENPSLVRRLGSEAEPAEATMLNAKAARFGTFSDALASRMYFHVRQLLHTYEFESRKLPDDIQPTEITATLDRSGKLTDLVLENHSGRAAVDKMFLEACKKGLWYRNPPVEALTSGDVYIVRIKAQVTNYASPDGKNWRFRTRIAIGLA